MLIFAFIVVTIGTEIFLLIRPDFDIKPESFVLSTALFFIAYAIIEFLFTIFITGWAMSIISVIPIIPLVFLFKSKEEWFYLIGAMIVAAVLRIFLCYFSYKDELFVFGIFALDATVLYMRWIYQSFGTAVTLNKLLLACLVAMTLAAVKEKFPLHFFILLAVLIFVMPMKDTPIDWTPVKTMMGKLSNATENAAYYLSDFYDKDGYTTGYGDLNSNGGKLKKSKKTQLSLSTAEAPYYIYTDDTTGKKMKKKRVLYLQGVEQVDKKQLIDFLQFLYDHQVDRTEAAVFSQISKVNIEYVYLNTEDEIIPAATIRLSGQKDGKHKKGYSLKTTYMDIDYGSPYLKELYKKPVENSHVMSYEEAVQYMNAVYRTDLMTILSEEEYEVLLATEEVSAEDKDAAGLTDEMKGLADEIVSSANNDYEKCKLIESYLRQFPYSTDTVGGYDEGSTMASARGMADIANRFLFETKRGYCVHFTSSMVMLLRASGIPARAVSGYRYTYPFDKEEEYLVPANNAHVWPEAYLDGIGWVPFEPTSGYLSNEEISWERTGIEAPAEEDMIDPVVWPDFDETLSYDKKEINRLFVVMTIIAVILTLLVLIGLAILITMLIKATKYKRASNEDKIKIDVENIKRELIKQCKSNFNDRGFLSDYLKLAPEELATDISDTFDLYYKLIYSDENENIIRPEDAIKARDVYSRLKEGNK